MSNPSRSTLLVFWLSALPLLPCLPIESRLPPLASISSAMLAMAEVPGETKLEKMLGVSTDLQPF